MIPLELKFDKNGLLFIDNEQEHILSKKPLIIDKRSVHEMGVSNEYYSFNSTDEYIVKYNSNLSYEEQKAYLEMLSNLVDKQKLISNTDFPIGYLLNNNEFSGLIVKYYKKGISLDNILNINDINLLGKYYYHDEDNIHNLFLLFLDILERINEMFENGVYYRDVNMNNIILANNKVKIVDFDPRYVGFSNYDEWLRKAMYAYSLFINTCLKYYQVNDSYIEAIKDFSEAKVYTKNLEERIMKK